MDDNARREAEQREREALERQGRLDNHASNMHIHQPIAVAPKVQIHTFDGYQGPQGPKPPYSTFEQGLPSMIQQRPGPEADVAQRTPQQIPQILAQPGPAQATPALNAYGNPPNSLTPAQQPILNDALSYLDQVKVQFADVPDVYNRFLDIMKDFKSSAIDTPGVIDRVSHLFAGNPGLIQGFNTFLPPGYKIECGTSDDPNAIRVTTPMGTTMQTMPTVRSFSPRSHPPKDPALAGPSGVDRGPFGEQLPPVGVQPQNGGMAEVYVDAQGRQIPPPGFMPQSLGMAVQDPYQSSMGSQIDQRGVAQLQSAANVAPMLEGRPGLISPPTDGLNAQPIANGLLGMSQQAAALAAEKRGPVEFNHAISYVNKIKNRFATQPDIYKQFLEILQTYQRESKPIQDVYAQVTRLFETAPDLLEDFKQFLPETAAHAKAASQRAAGEDVYALNGLVRADLQQYGAQLPQAQLIQQTPAKNEQPRLPPMGNFAPTPSTNRDNKRKRPNEKGSAATMAPVPQPDLQGRSVAPQTGGPNKRAKHGQAVKAVAATEIAPISPSLVPALPLPMTPNFSVQPTAEDINFFDRVRKHLNNKGSYTEFLKLVNLFTQDLCTAAYIVYRAQQYIGNNPELYKWFKNFIGSEAEDEVIEHKPVPPTGRIALSNCRGLGPSYRLLPKIEQNKLCSGRDQLCQEVLNDEWVSHPTWASEDSGFVAHRKNQYEEGLHRIEEERHDYDTHLGVVERTIQQLEPIAQQLAHMQPEQRNTLTLDEYIGGQSKAIYRRAIFKIYGRESGNNVVKRLLSDPYSCVPVLLQRCKQMREQWKAGQREWNKVWRQQTNSMFWRSLDHQGAGARGDRRQFTTKFLQSELLVRDEEQKRTREHKLESTPNHQLEMTFTDTAVLYDCFTLLMVHLNYKAEAQDQPRLEPFLREFAQVFFGLDPNALRESFGSTPDEVSQQDAESMVLDDGGPVRPKPASRKSGNLLRGLFEGRRNGRNKRDNGDSIASDSRGSSPEPIVQQDADMADAPLTPPPEDNNTSRVDAPRWLQHPTEDLPGQRNPKPDEPYRRSEYNMYANWTVYSFYRLLSMLYDRLNRIKTFESAVKETVARESVHKPANEIGWIEKMPSDFFENTNHPDTNYYQQMLAKFELQIRDPSPDLAADVEETLRRFYLYFGWQLYNCERLVANTVKAAIGIVGNDVKDSSNQIWNAFRKDRVREETTHNEELHYRKQAEKLAKESDLIRVSYDENTHMARVKVLRKTDITFSGSGRSALDRWQEYLASFSLVEPTEAIDYDAVGTPVIRRTLPKNWTKTGTLAFDRASGPGGVNGTANGTTNGVGRNGLSSLNNAVGLSESDLVSEENMQTRISFQTYSLAFQSGTRDFTQKRDKRLPAEEAIKLSDGLKELTSEREAELRVAAERGTQTSTEGQVVLAEQQQDTEDLDTLLNIAKPKGEVMVDAAAQDNAEAGTTAAEAPSAEAITQPATTTDGPQNDGSRIKELLELPDWKIIDKQPYTEVVQDDEEAASEEMKEGTANGQVMESSLRETL